MKIFFSMLFATQSLLMAGEFKLNTVLGELQQPVFVTHAPGDSKSLYIVEQAGRILKHSGGRATQTFLDIKRLVKVGGEMGLLSMAFHPKFSENQRYFVYYTAKGSARENKVVEYKAGSTKAKMLLSTPNPYSNHNGGQIAFGPDGFLYIGKGDGGDANDPHGNGQNKNTHLAKILRIDVDSEERGLPYGIPNSNPFVSGGGLPEIFAYGLRNPWRFSFDRLTGALFAADVGQDELEEIDLVQNGKNYGWSIQEGTQCFNPKTNCSKKGLVAPLYEYGRNEGESITGGYVYRGSAIPDLRGVYVYGDFQSGKIWGLHLNENQTQAVRNELLLKTSEAISSFGEDSSGEILVIGYGGTVFRLVKP